jgi:Raf kinase inhibitor-like YbhB/YbcL family protein
VIGRLLLAPLLLLALAAETSGLELSSPAFAPGGDIPARYTCRGSNVSPPLQWSAPPEGTRSLVLLVEDPVAIAGTWVHWVFYAMPPTVRRLPQAVPQRDRVKNVGIQGVNSFRRIGWTGPCPRPGPPHHYVFKLAALDVVPGLPPRVTRAQVLAAIEGHVLARAELTGRFAR